MARSSWIPIRTCIGCRRRQPKPTLIMIKIKDGRFEVYPPGTKLPGRSLYLCPNRECLNLLQRRKKVIFKAQPPGRTIIPLSSEIGKELLYKLERMISELDRPAEPAEKTARQKARGKI